MSLYQASVIKNHLNGQDEVVVNETYIKCFHIQGGEKYQKLKKEIAETLNNRVKVLLTS
ncbi:hypothetical protein ACFQZW_11595 [Lutibacter aestuarii]|uniref:Uncharacterized protein n=1 Tax=Lutibacter aestuarii TaxID=861111 RepID=A0ABW2Z9T7_9FLAO